MVSSVIAVIGVFSLIGDATAATEWLLTIVMFLFSRPAAAIVVIAGLLYVFQDLWVPVYRRFSVRARQTFSRKPAFLARPIPGDTLPWAGNPELLTKHRITARLAIRNTSNTLLRKCSVRLQDAFLLQAGHILSGSCFFPSICNARGESFLLRWADSESSTADQKYLDIPPDGAEHITEVLMLNVPERSADFAPANRGDLENRLSGVANGWWKLRIKISAADGTHVDTEWVAACSDRDPGPITLDNWDPRGEAILRDQRKRIQATRSA